MGGARAIACAQPDCPKPNFRPERLRFELGGNGAPRASAARVASASAMAAQGGGSDRADLPAGLGGSGGGMGVETAAMIVVAGMFSGFTASASKP